MKRETADTYTLELTRADGAADFAFAPGQFNMLYAFGAGEVPISISGDPNESGRLYYTVRSVGKATHALVNLKPGQAVELGVRARENDGVKSSVETSAGRGIPKWLTLDASAFKGQVLAAPTREDITLDINEQLIVELYSK